MTKRLTEKMLIWAHRGASAYAPENTLEAFQLAVDMKADGVELDVHFSRAGRVIVAHDAKIDRMSNGQGAILDYTYDELQVFSFHNKMPEFKNARVPTLEQVYALLAPTGLWVNVEIKAGDPALAKACVDIAEQYGMTDRVLYSSFNHLQLIKVHEVDPTRPIAPLYSFNMIKPWLYAENMGAMATHPNAAQLKTFPEYVEECHARGIRVHPWTVDDEEMIRFLWEAGADAIITNKPDFARQVIEACEAE